MSNRLVLVTLDALQEDDLDTLLSLPYMRRLQKELAIVRRVRPIYPTLTYPIHTTMITGRYPEDHGISHNQIPGIAPENPDFNLMGSNWYWHYDAIAGETLLDLAKAHGKRLGIALWPVTAGFNQDLTVPEIWPMGTDRAPGADTKDFFAQVTSPQAMDLYYESFMRHYDWQNTEDMCDYGVEIAIDMLRHHDIDLLLLHVIHLDHARHVLGDHGPLIDGVLRELDIIIYRLATAVKDAGNAQQTNFIFLGDHGQIDVARIFAINRLFREAGLISLDEAGVPTNYDAYSFSAGFSTHIHLRDKNDQQLMRQVHDFLRKLQTDYPHLIERVYTAEEIAQAERLRGDFSFVLEGTTGTLFGNAPTGDLVITADDPNFHDLLATYGHHPDKGANHP